MGVRHDQHSWNQLGMHHTCHIGGHQLFRLTVGSVQCWLSLVNTVEYNVRQEEYERKKSLPWEV